jgi:DNA-binding transcriptional LysR family regulator
MPLDYVLSAAPAYLARHGTPTAPMDLSAHHCITGTDTGGATWRFDGPDGPTVVPINGRLQVNNAMLRCDAARAGAGILLCADYLVEHDFANGSLVHLLPEHRPASSTLHAVSPTYRAGSPKVRSLVNHLTTQLADAE